LCGRPPADVAKAEQQIRAAENYANGLAGPEALEAARWVCLGDRDAFRAAVLAAEWMVGGDSLMVDLRRAKDRRDRLQQLGFLRDIVGNPFRPVSCDPSWRTSTAVALAHGMYESLDFSPIPILADALQDVGCDSEDILAHCRGPGPHVRGCWVADLVLGRE